MKRGRASRSASAFVVARARTRGATSLASAAVAIVVLTHPFNEPNDDEEHRKAERKIAGWSGRPGQVCEGRRRHEERRRRNDGGDERSALCGGSTAKKMHDQTTNGCRNDSTRRCAGQESDVPGIGRKEWADDRTLPG